MCVELKHPRPASKILAVWKQPAEECNSLHCCVGSGIILCSRECVLDVKGVGKQAAIFRMYSPWILQVMKFRWRTLFKRNSRILSKRRLKKVSRTAEYPKFRYIFRNFIIWQTEHTDLIITIHFHFQETIFTQSDTNQNKIRWENPVWIANFSVFQNHLRNSAALKK